ncbi:MAG: hypothetical protein ACTSRW_00745, partial [Candidatus Helarchaeota archaeon]
GGTAIKMVQMVLGALSITNPFDILYLILLEIVFISLIAPTAFLWSNLFFMEYMMTAGITQASYIPIVVCSTITWISTGIVVGILSKEWFGALETAAITGIMVYFFDVVLVMLVIITKGLLFTGPLLYGGLYIAAAAILLMALPNLILLTISGTAGGVAWQLINKIRERRDLY